MIRRITAEDWDIFCELTQEFYQTEAVLHPIGGDGISRTFDELMVSDQYIEGFLILKKGEVAGYGIIAKTFSPEVGGKVVWFEEIYIRPNFQGVGLGKEFFDFVEKTYSEEIKRLRLEVEAENKRAIKLYNQLGYQELAYQQMVKEL